MSNKNSTDGLSRPTPPCSDTLGIVIEKLDKEAGRVTASFDAKPDFCNPHGTIQGGFLSAMLDEICALAAVAKLDGKGLIATLEASTRYLRPAHPGKISGTATVLKLGTSTAFVEGELRSQDGELLAKMSTTSKVVPSA